MERHTGQVGTSTAHCMQSALLLLADWSVVPLRSHELLTGPRKNGCTSMRLAEARVRPSPQSAYN